MESGAGHPCRERVGRDRSGTEWEEQDLGAATLQAEVTSPPLLQQRRDGPRHGQPIAGERPARSRVPALEHVCAVTPQAPP